MPRAALSRWNRRGRSRRPRGSRSGRTTAEPALRAAGRRRLVRLDEGRERKAFRVREPEHRAEPAALLLGEDEKDRERPPLRLRQAQQLGEALALVGGEALHEPRQLAE